MLEIEIHQRTSGHVTAEAVLCHGECGDVHWTPTLLDRFKAQESVVHMPNLNKAMLYSQAWCLVYISFFHFPSSLPVPIMSCRYRPLACRLNAKVVLGLCFDDLGKTEKRGQRN